MLSTPMPRDDNCHASLSTMPPEVATNIFCQLPSFSDVFALSAVCLRLRHLWLENVNPIYNQIAPRVIPCDRAARRFLVDQDGPGLGSPMTAKDVVRMVRNAGVIEKAILQFEREIVRRVRGESNPDEKIARRVVLTFVCYSGCPGLSGEFYGPSAHEHPPTLTLTERKRFIRYYYPLWSLMRIDQSEWDSTLQGMTSQELYYLWEMARLTQSIGREEIVPPPMFPNQPPDSIHSINHGRSQKRIDLEQWLWQQIERNSWRFFEQEAHNPCVYAKPEGHPPFIVLWDHWQPPLKEIICHKYESSVQPSPAVIEQYLWRDGLDE